MTSKKSGSKEVHGHSPQRLAGVADAYCPYCGAPVTRAEFQEIQVKIEEEGRARAARIEADLIARVGREVAKAEAQAKAAVEKAKRDAAKAAEHQVRALRASQDAVIQARVLAQREADEKKLTEAVAAERTRAYEERMRLDDGHD